MTTDNSNGWLAVVGTGPGADEWRIPQVDALVAQATDLVGYGLYLDILGPLTDGKTLHTFPLGEEELRVRHALKLAAEGKKVALVSSGDPGIYAMATLVFELMDRGEPVWKDIDVTITPGISALQAASARIGAPLGHDFCTVSLSDLLTPWETIENRLNAAAQGDFVVAFYNPVSLKRRWQFDKAIEILRTQRPDDTPVILGRNLGREGETMTVMTIDQVKADHIDMLTVVLVGSSQTRIIERGAETPYVYTPRGYEDKKQ